MGTWLYSAVLVLDYHGELYYTNTQYRMQNPYLEKIIEILRKLDVSIAITDNLALVGDSILDSMEFMNYITQVEETFDLEISDEDIEQFKLGIIGNMVTYLTDKTSS